MKGCKCTARFSAISLALSLGIVSGLWMALFAWSALWSGHGVVMVAQWGEIFQGYAATVRGGWIGGAWGFVEGFIVGLIVAWIYNFFLCCCKSLCKSSDECCDVKKVKK